MTRRRRSTRRKVRAVILSTMIFPDRCSDFCWLRSIRFAIFPLLFRQHRLEAPLARHAGREFHPQYVVCEAAYVLASAGLGAVSGGVAAFAT